MVKQVYYKILNILPICVDRIGKSVINSTDTISELEILAKNTCKITHKRAKMCKNFAKICKMFSNFCIFLLIFARLCVFLHAFFVLIFQAQKLCQCYFSRFFQLCWA